MADMALRAWVAVESWLKELREREAGQAMVEYGIILALISVIAIVFIVTLGEKVMNTFSYVASAY